MTYKEILNFLSNIKVDKRKLMIFLKNHYYDIYNEILTSTSFLDVKGNVTFSERLYCIRSDIHSLVLCKECKEKPVEYLSDGFYRDFCSVSCSSKNKDVISLKNKSHIEKTGFDIRSDPNRIKKGLETKIKKYGIDNITNQKKARETRLNKYGSFNPKDIVDKIKKTKLEKYGNANWVNPQKAIDTLRKKYNDETIKCALTLPSTIKKTKEGIRSRSYDFISHLKDISPLFSKDEYINKDSSFEFEFKCNTCGNIFKSQWDNGILKNPCKKCHPGLRGTSEAELEVVNYLKSIVPVGWKVVNHDKLNKQLIPPYEIDIIIYDENDNIKLLIEYDGLYFHSYEIKNNKNYHLEKTEKCETQKLQLIHIFENEWLSKTNIVKDRLKNLLGIYDKTIYARKCYVKEVDSNTTKMFLRINHIQGACQSSVNIGLFFEDELISIMTFGKPRFNKTYEWELLRFCNKAGFHITGGASKLLNYFEKNYKPKSLISYADRRWSKGNLYEKLGFSHIGNSRPNYWYFKINNPIEIFNRVKFQKHKLKNTSSNYDEKLTEQQIMRLDNYGIIYDCGNMVFLKKSN